MPGHKAQSYPLENKFNIAVCILTLGGGGLTQKNCCPADFLKRLRTWSGLFRPAAPELEEPRPSETLPAAAVAGLVCGWNTRKSLEFLTQPL